MVGSASGLAQRGAIGEVGDVDLQDEQREDDRKDAVVRASTRDGS